MYSVVAAKSIKPKVSKYRASNRSDSHQEQCGPADPDGAEPVVFLTFVEDDLQAADPYHQRAQADAVESNRLRSPHVRRVFDKSADHEDSQDADRYIDIERVTPAIGVSEPASQCGSEDGGAHHAEPKQRHGDAALLRWKTLQKDGLRQRLQSSAAGPLQYTRCQNEAKRGRSATRERRSCEDGDTDDEEALAPDPHRKPVRSGKHDRISN
jgi:hypothetical protein